MITGRVEPLTNNIWQYFAPHYYQGETPKESPVLLEGNCAMRKKVFEDLNGFDENLDYGHEGEEFLSRAKKYKVMYYPNMVICHDYAFGLRNYLRKQFKFGEKTAYLRRQKPPVKKQEVCFPSKKKPSLKEKILIKAVARLGSFSHLLGQVYGNLKYKNVH